MLIRQLTTVLNRAMSTSISTEARWASATEVFTGPFAITRALLDYKWHSHYIPERQAVQDTIISKLLCGGVRVEKPWLIYTAGPMGAGKSHTLRYLHKIGAFPLDKFIWLDPDRVKSMLPEMPTYVVQNRTMAGVLTHKESGFIAEIIEREAMQQNKCVLVDGSLRNREWYAREFGRIRAEFPQYSIAILLITASKETVYRRAMRRAAITAREVPREVLDEAMDQVPRSFQALAPLADYSAVLNNDSDEDGVMFEPPATLERFQCLWNRIAAAPWDDPNDAQGGLPCDSLDADGDRHSVRSEAELYAQMLKSHGVSPLEGGRASDSGVSTPTSSSSSSSGGGAGAMPVAPSAIPSHHVPSSNSVVHSCDSNTGISAALGGATTYNHDNGNTTSVGLASVKPVR